MPNQSKQDFLEDIKDA